MSLPNSSQRGSGLQPEATDVLYEDNHLLIVNKPAGMLVQGDKTGDVPLVEHGKVYLKQKYHKPGDVFLGVVHRLDRPVSGVVVLARTSKALARMNKLFQEKQVTKTYWALVDKEPPQASDTLSHWLTKNPQKNRATAHRRQVPHSKSAILTYRLLIHRAPLYLLEVTPQTGRPHQIRVQLASVGCPIRGDLKYGATKANDNASISLHARALSFVHPVKREPLRVIAPLPHEAGWNALSAADVAAIT